MHSKYDSSASLTYKANGSEFSIARGDALVEGFVSQDTLVIGELRVKDQLYAEATRAAGLAFAFVRYDGILGLAYDTISVNHITSPFYSMLNQGLLDAPVFAVYLSSDVEPGELILGGYDIRPATLARCS